MEKRMPVKSPQLPDKYPSGCGWGLTRFFDLFNGHSHQKLISNLGRSDRHKRGDDRAKTLPASDKKHRDDKKLLGIYPRTASVGSSRRGKHGQHSPEPEKIAEMDKINKSSAHRGKNAKHWGNQKPDSPRTGRHRFSRTDSAGNISRWALSDVFCGHGCRNAGCVDNGVTGTQSAHLSEAVANQKFLNCKSNQTKQLLEALQILNSNEDLFLKLLEDPKSLPGRHIKDLRDSQGKMPSTQYFMRLHEGNGRTCGTRKGSRLNPSNRIVILKPQPEWCVRNKVLITRQSYFPLRRLRRKLRWAQLKKCLLSNVEAEAASACKHSCKDITNFSLNGDCETQRKYLFKLSNWTDGIRKFSQEKLQRNLSRSLSFPEYDFSSFFGHERKEHGFVGAQMRYCPYTSYQVNKDDSKLRPLRETNGSISSLRLTEHPVASVSDEKSRDQSGGDTSSNLAVGIETQGTVTSPMHTSSEGSTEFEVSQAGTSSSPTHIQAAKNSAISSSKEDDVNQLRFDEADCMEFHLGSGPNLDGPNDDLQSANDYVKALLVAADLNWDALLSSHELGQILRPSLFDEFKVASDRHAVDHRLLLFDYINEVLEEVYRCYQGKIRTFTVEKNVTHAVLERVHRDGDQLLQKGSPTLEKVMCKDLTGWGTWIDIPGSTEEIVAELVDDILDDVISEI